MSTHEAKPKAHTLESVSSNDYTPSPMTFSQKTKAHFKRFWWLHLIVFLIGVLIITLCVIFVGMPNIAQKGINDARLTLEAQAVTSPTPNSVHLLMNTTSHSDSSYHPQLYPFRAALFLEDTEPDIKPFGYLDMPAVKAAKTVTIVVNQDMEIADQDQFARYNKLVLTSDTYRVAIRGRVPLKEGGLPKTTVDFNHVVTSKGLNNLQGFEIRNISISLVPDADGSNMKGQVYISNPSPMTIEMGTVTQNVYVGDTMIGVATIPELTLKPGDNLVNMSSAANQATVIGLIATKYTNGKLPVRIVGNNSTVNGQEIPYFTSALKSQTLNTTLDLGPALKAAGLDLSSGLGIGSTTASSSSTTLSPATSATSSAA